MTKQIDIDDELYRYIASHTQHIGESASAILRRLLGFQQAIVPATPAPTNPTRTIFDVMSKADLAGQRSIVARFLYILSMLHRCHAQQFERVLQITGRDRKYFATVERELEEAGTSTNPKQIPDSDYYVVTNNNTTRKKMMLTQVALELGYNQTQAERIRDLL
ncbi:replication initiation regulator SeqA [Pseudidiomarina mangrovi]|uniref:replication initiation regulator SeqA n=1 Tax=Pseudidiomarina mangrovi TaxID=2487133 RepID=UPI000FCCD081|nr:replication initiation regulator SeqA [Pseudidiomarina mangrovi]